MLIIFERILAIFIMILIGYAANRAGILPDSSRKHLTNLMIYITAPCMAAESIYSKELSPEVVTATWQVIIGAAVYFVIITVFAYVFIRALKFKPKKEWGVYVVAITCINSGFMGFPVTKAIFGDDLFYLMVMHNIIAVFYIWSITPMLLNIGTEKGEGGKSRFAENIKAMFNPCTFGIIIGVIMLIFGIKPPTAVDEVVASLSDATVPVSMIIVGVQLGSSHIIEMLKNRYIFLVNIAAMIISPVLTFLIVEQFDFLQTGVKVILIFASVFPTAVVPAAIAEKMGKDPTRLAEIVSVTTAFSLITIPLISAFLMGYYY